MPEPAINQDRFQKAFLLCLVIAISALFFAMIRSFLIALLLAGIFSGMAHPLYVWLHRRFNGHAVAASIVTLLIAVFVVLVPLSILGTIVAGEALQVSEAVRPWIEERLQRRSELDAWLDGLPFIEYVRPYQEQIIAKLGEFTGTVGTFLVNGLAAATSGTAAFFFQFFIMLYAMFFFLMNGQNTLDKILYYMPLSNEEESQMLDRFVSVTRATVKGTIVIGIIQGGLAGLGFAVAGIPSATFWGTIMAVMSIIPALGAALVWVPGVIYLIAMGHTGAAIALAIWCAAVVSSADNVLRPRLVGKDTKMSDLMVLLGTLGGIVLFGIVGVIIGPIFAALFVTVWEIYGVAFKEMLPEVPEREDLHVGDASDDESDSLNPEEVLPVGSDDSSL